MTVGVILAILAAGLAVLLARETKLRRALQALCSRLLARLSDLQKPEFPRPTPPYRHRSRRR
jgi:hypothetical protein